MTEYDRGPTKAWAQRFAQVPSYEPDRTHFWYDWGPVFYRGRLDGKARLLCVASDPGPTERVACRTLVGDAGQRVQGFLSKVGLTRSYVCLNALAYALFPSHGQSGLKVIQKPEHTAWRNLLFDHVRPGLQAVVAFGRNAQLAVDLWPGLGALPRFDVPHPSSRDETVLLNAWRAAVTALRGIVTPDPKGDPTLPNYGAKFLESDYSRVPAGDLPFGVPDWLGDDAWGRAAKPRHNNSVSRPSPDDRHTLIWIAPDTAPPEEGENG